MSFGGIVAILAQKLVNEERAVKKQAGARRPRTRKSEAREDRVPTPKAREQEEHARDDAHHVRREPNSALHRGEKEDGPEREEQREGCILHASSGAATVVTKGFQEQEEKGGGEACETHDELPVEKLFR